MVDARAHAPQQTSATKNEVHQYKTTIRKLYTDDCGRFPIKSRSGENYIMIVYHCDKNALLQVYFATRSEQNRIAAYNSIMKRLPDKGHKADLQILDNKASYEYKRVITEKCQAKYQLVPPNVHQSNSPERAMHTFKAHFI